MRRSDGTPASNVQVRERDGEQRPLARTGSDGSFRANGLAPGRLVLLARGLGPERCEPVTVEIEPGHTHHVELVLDPL